MFAATPDRGKWVEYTVSVKKTGKLVKPFKLNATLAWRSSSKVQAIAAIRGSYESRNAALSAVQNAAEEEGRYLIKITGKDLKWLVDKFGYPNGRSSYLLENAVLKPGA